MVPGFGRRGHSDDWGRHLTLLGRRIFGVLRGLSHRLVGCWALLCLVDSDVGVRKGLSLLFYVMLGRSVGGCSVEIAVRGEAFRGRLWRGAGRASCISWWTKIVCLLDLIWVSRRLGRPLLGHNPTSAGLGAQSYDIGGRQGLGQLVSSPAPVLSDENVVNSLGKSGSLHLDRAKELGSLKLPTTEETSSLFVEQSVGGVSRGGPGGWTGRGSWRWGRGRRRCGSGLLVGRRSSASKRVLPQSFQVGLVDRPLKRQSVDVVLLDVELSDLGFVGPCFTRCNRRPWPATVRCRLDRALSTVAWRALFSDSEVESSFWSIDVRNELTEHRSDLEGLLTDESTKWQQRAKQHWLVEGDRRLCPGPKRTAFIVFGILKGGGVQVRLLFRV
ncbi:hypothetical protein Salat_1176300 [Sesamum alatum]|uniref:Uncharacterized protein n=1 Tax=Sesamum alatum TaxID=300844 RepID=A0AAE2CNW1_9LAMI|nr:hypothetical protein Salat_1176300 [Sesamum alatum]